VGLIPADGRHDILVNQLGELLTDLLDVSKLDAGVIAPQPVDFSIADLLLPLLNVHGAKAQMFSKMLPKGAGKLKLSQMHMGGMGTNMMKGLMRKKNVMALEQLMKVAAESGVRIYVCQMSMELMGFSVDELIDYPNLKVAGVAKFLQEAGSSKSTLFI
jgi:peroxiredoxin family protein